MTWIFKNVYIDKLDDVLNKWNTLYHSTIKLSSFYVRKAHILICIKRRTKNIINTQLVSTYKNIFAKGYVPNWSEEVFAITKVKNTVLWTCVISDFKGE